MIITRAPFRISFFGGTTDYPIWYHKHGGQVLSTTINKYCYIMCRYLPPFFKYKYRIRYRKTEKTKYACQIKHPTVRACLKLMGIEQGIEMVHSADLPARSGIGSSSTFTVCFLHALYALKGKMVGKRQLALDAIRIEQKLENIGSQDQTAAAYGGLNHIVFDAQNEITVNPVIINPSTLSLFQKHFMLFFTGFSRTSSEVAGKYIKRIPLKAKQLCTLHEQVDTGLELLQSNNLKAFGDLMHEAWINKKAISKHISTPHIDEIYKEARSAGALGGKLVGSGSGGFMLLYVPLKAHLFVKKRLSKLLRIPFEFETSGSEIILYNPRHLGENR